MTDTNTLRVKIADKARTASATALIVAIMLIASLFAGVGPVSASSHDVEVTVTDSTGTAVENATVGIIDTADGTTVETASTDSSGYYETNLSDGDYDVIVSTNGYQTSDQIITHTSGTVSTVDFSLAESTGTGTLEVTVEDTSGDTIDGATADLIDPSNGTVVQSTTTDSSGVAAFNDAATGTYEVVLSHPDYTQRALLGVNVPDSATKSFAVQLTGPTEWTFAVNTADGTPSSLFAELSNGTYDLTWYTFDRSGVRTDITTETVNVTDGATVHEFTPENLSAAANHDRYGVDIAFNATESPDAEVLNTGILYEADGGGSGSSSDSGAFGLSEDQSLIAGGVIVFLILITAVVASKPD